MKKQAGRQGREKHPERARKGKRLKKNEEELRELQDNMNRKNIHIIGTPEGEEEDQVMENMFKK